MINPPQSDIVERHVNDAVEKGARVLAGGSRRDENGHFFEPTVLVDVDHSMACMREETFGPTLPIMKVRDAEEAVRLANDTPYGLQASVWTKDAAKGERLARRIEAGAVTVNDAQINYVALELPMGGWKESGLGTPPRRRRDPQVHEEAERARHEFAPMKKDLHMLPYSAKRTRFLRGCSSSSTGADDGGIRPGRLRRALDGFARFDGSEGVVRAARALRSRLPGDRSYGDPLSVSGDEPPQLIGQRLAAASEARPSATRELGFGALQVWQALSEAQGRGRGDDPLAILFTDLVGFSDWALEAGDDAALEASRAVGEIEVGGYRPQLRAGIHFGRPRKLGGDYFGVDVNVAARVADAAGPGEVLISEAVCEQLGGARAELRRRWRFKAKGAPKDLKVYVYGP